MNLEFFITKRLITGKENKSSISAPIIKIAIVAIALSVIMMLFAIATGEGLKEKVREKVAAFNGHIQIYNYDNNTSDVSVVPVSIHQEFYPKFKNIDGISHVQAIANKGGIIIADDTFEGIIAKGVGADYNWNVFEEYIVEGRLPNYNGKLNEEVLLSSLMANRLQLSLGDKFSTFFLKDDNPSQTPNRRNFTIVGIYNSRFEEFDGTYVFVDIRHIQRINKWKKDEVGSFEVFLNSFDDIDAKSKEIYGATLSTLDSNNIKKKYSSIFEWISLFDFNVTGIIGIMIIVGGINMITALLVLILERTQMIGILKALGAASWSVRKIFLYNAIYLICIGLFWGNLIGLGLLFLQDKFKFLKFADPKEYYIEYIPIHIDFLVVVLLNIGVIFLCLLMLLLPSYIITRISPVKSIKFE